jgi:hypothetical protein
MMRSTLLSLLVASASAFAPAQQVCSLAFLLEEVVISLFSPSAGVESCVKTMVDQLIVIACQYFPYDMYTVNLTSFFFRCTN